MLGVEGRLGGAVEWETDRARFLGRGRSPANPMALDGRALSGTTGAVLDPMAALRERVRLAPGAFVRVTFATGVAPDRDDGARAGAQVPRRQRRGARVLDGVHARAHHAAALGLTDDHAMLFDRLASRVFGSDASVHRAPTTSRATRFGQSNLWGYGISGDLPIVLVRVTDADALPLVRQVLHAQEYWRVKDLRADVVILNEHPADYLDEMQDQLAALVQEPRWSGWLDKPGGMFLLRADGMPDADRHLLLGRRARRPARRPRRPGAAARSAGARGCSPARRPGVEPHCGRRSRRADAGAVPPLVMENGLGGFTPDGREYVDRARRRPRDAAAVVERARQPGVRHDRDSVGRGVHLGREQPREPADAVRQRSDHRSDRRGDLPPRRRDRRGVGRDAGPLPRPARRGRWVVRHAAGVTRFQHAVDGLEQELDGLRRRRTIR